MNDVSFYSMLLWISDERLPSSRQGEGQEDVALYPVTWNPAQGGQLIREAGGVLIWHKGGARRTFFGIREAGGATYTCDKGAFSAVCKNCLTPFFTPLVPF